VGRKYDEEAASGTSAENRSGIYAADSGTFIGEERDALQII
jgi:hypothetical protein